MNTKTDGQSVDAIIAALEQTIPKATSGDWFYNGLQLISKKQDGWVTLISSDLADDDSAYMACASPERIQKLLGYIRALEAKTNAD